MKMTLRQRTSGISSTNRRLLRNVAAAAVLAVSMVGLIASPAQAFASFNIQYGGYTWGVTPLNKSLLDNGNTVLYFNLCQNEKIKNAGATAHCVKVEQVIYTTDRIVLFVLEDATINGKNVQGGDFFSIQGRTSTYNPDFPAVASTAEEVMLTGSEIGFQAGLTKSGYRYVKYFFPSAGDNQLSAVQTVFVQKNLVTTAKWNAAIALTETIQRAKAAQQNANTQSAGWKTSMAVIAVTGVYRTCAVGLGEGVLAAAAGFVTSIFFDSAHDAYNRTVSLETTSATNQFDAAFGDFTTSAILH